MWTSTTKKISDEKMGRKSNISTSTRLSSASRYPSFPFELAREHKSSRGRLFIFIFFIFLLTARAAVESRLSVSIDKIEELDATMMNSEHVF